MKRTYWIVSIGMALFLTACSGRQETPKPEKAVTEGMEEKKPESEHGVSYDYSGVWTESGITEEEWAQDGGLKLTATVTEENIFQGTILAKQGITERFAEIDNISGQIVNNEIYFEFSDDGWSGTGTLHFSFAVNSIRIEVMDYQLSEENASGYGISGAYHLQKEGTGDKKIEPDAKDKHDAKDKSGAKDEVDAKDKSGAKDEADTKSEQNQAGEQEPGSKAELTEEEITAAYYKKYYDTWSAEEMEEAIRERSSYYKQSRYYDEVMDYMENVRESGDIANVAEPLFYTDMKYYSKEDFEGIPQIVIKLARNEIYARHGYIFANQDLNNYFMGCIWYQPSCTAEDFDDSVFNDYEKANVLLLSELDKTL